MRRAADGLAARGVSVVTFEFTNREAGRGRPDPGPRLEERFASAWEQVHASAPARNLSPRAWFAGGKSMGGRIASQVAARGRFLPPPAGLVFFGYPLHPPTRPDERRDRHLPAIPIPMLFLHGTRDPFGSPAEMAAVVDGLPQGDLVLLEGGNHSLESPKRSSRPGAAAVEDALDRAAEWMLATVPL
jgi:predicted alpha/beta-hydrolase family hydrolase